MRWIRTGVPLMAAAMVLALMLTACADQGGRAVPTAEGAGSPASATTAAPAAVPTQAASAAPAATEAATATAAPQATVEPAAAATSTSAPTTAPTATVTDAPTASPTAAATAAPTALATAAPAQAAAPNLAALQLALKPLVSGLSNPLDVVNAGDGSGRLFVVEKTGALRIVAGGKLLDAPFLDIKDRITSAGSEQGLLGLAFPPDYATRKFFFVNYTNTKGDTVISRFSVTSDPNVADPASEFVVLTFDQPAANHNGGDLVFGPDGYLWIGTGDGGGANDTYRNGQNPNSFLAKMLRIDVTSDTGKPYVVPQDNPAVAQGWQVKPEAWAIGLRNPWRYSFDRATGDLWIADVGQNRLEEVNVVRAGSKGGMNFGWPIMEGPNCLQGANCDRTGLTLPVASYQHGVDGCSVTGGFVYRGQQFPALQGVYLYGDYCTGRMWGLDAANPGASKQVLEVGPGLSSFGEDEAGELYITDLAKGTISQIVLK